MRLRKRAYMGPGAPVGAPSSFFSLELNSPLARSTSSAKNAPSEALAHVVEVVRSEADAEPGDGLRRLTPRPVRYSRARAAAGAFQLGFKVLGRRLPAASISVPPQAGLAGLLGGVKTRASARGMPALAATARTASGKLMFIELHHEREDVALLMAPETIKISVIRIDRKGTRLLLMERTKPRIVLRAGLAQLHIVAHDLDDIHLRLHGLCKVVRHGLPMAQFRGSRAALPDRPDLHVATSINRP